MRRIVVLGCAWVFLVSGRLLGQGTTGQMEQLPPPGYGSLSQSDLSLRVRSGDLDIRLVPLDERVTRLLARDAYQSLQGLVQSKQSAIDSLARVAGISAPGLALVSFFAQREGTRFDPQTLTLLIRNRLFRPRGIVPFSPRFTSQQLNVREQASAIFLFEELLPVTDGFKVSYEGRDSDDWESKQRVLISERGRVQARSRLARPDSVPAQP